ncbi:unnamed protein product [Larinioides sclopetarius]|uniref:Uncharacterized protein n=1 Tax=Larinioides sclopetarius TaxID=280406 RepID=A0AAV2BUM6_9ARAC
MNNINKIELPVGVRERSKKKIKLEDNVLGPNTVLTSQEFSERISTLQQIMRKEEELKVAIACENLRKDQPALLNTDILNTKIDEYRQLVQEARSKLKMKDVMLSNLELARTFQRIVGKSKATSTKNDFSDSQRKCIEDLLKKKKELNRSISIKRKEIAKTDEDVLKLENAVPTVKETRSTRAKMNDLEELERLKSDSENVAERIHLLSRIIQSLIPETGRQEDSDLMELMTECEKVSKCKLDDLDDIKALLSGVCSVNLRADSTRMDCFIDAE